MPDVLPNETPADLETLWARLYEALRLASLSGADCVLFEIRDAETLLNLAEQGINIP